MMREDWIEVELGDITSKITDGSHNPPKKQDVGLPMLSATNILDDKIVFDNYRLIDPVEFESECKRANVEPEDILLTIVGTIGRSAVVPHNIKKFTLQRSVALIKLDGLNSKYISFALRSPSIQSFFKEQSKGTAQKGIYLNTLKKITIPLAPLPEQRAIAAKIEQLFSELDNGIANFKAAKSKLEIYRQAILKQAFEGKLTNPENQIEDDLPKNWKWVKLGEVAEVKRGKSKHRPRNDKQLFGDKYPFIQTGDVKAANGGVIRNYSQAYSDFGLAQSKLWQKGTLCLTIAANIADTAFLGFDACFPDSVVGISSDENVLSLNFLNYLIQKLKIEIDSKASATAQKNINVEFLDKLLIPFCPIEEQTQIVQEIETRLSVCDKLNESIDQSLEKAQALRQSILKKAFEGKLLSQNELQTCRQQPDWEPAAKLLERVKNQKSK